jgi:acetyltransferase
VVLHDPAIPEEQLPRTVIRPYPDQYVSTWKVPETGVNVIIRPIRPEDEPMIVEFHAGLSDHTVYMRYFSALKLSQRTTHERLTRVCSIDYDREIALVAELRDPQTQQKKIIGVARLVRFRNSPADAEFAVLVSDAWHRQRVGSELARRLIDVARAEKIRHLQGAIMPDNVSMQRLAERLGFAVRYSDEEKLVMADLDL